jgi:ribosome-associated protein
MLIVEDTRNQVGKHKAVNEYLESQGHKVVRSKMLVGDYMIANDGSVAIDTKMSVLELIADIYQQHDRFRRECQLAQEAGIQLYVLTEEELPGGRHDKLVSPKWQTFNQHHHAGDPKSMADPKRPRKALFTMQERYGVKFRFCSKENTGAEIVRLLTEGKQ